MTKERRTMQMNHSTTQTTPRDEARKARQAFRPAAEAPADLHYGDPRSEPMAAVFPTAERAQDAIARLMRAGLHVEQVSVVTPAPDDIETDAVEIHEAPPEAAKTWASTGGVLGALTGGAAASGFVATAGLGALAVAGPLFIGVTGGAIVGALVGAMVRRGFAPETADRYVRAACEGGTLLVVEVRSDEQARQVANAFDEAGATREA